MNTVYGVSFNPAYDYTDTKRFGDLVFMTKGYVLGLETSVILENFEKFLEHATKNDYLLLSGTTLLCSLAMVAWIRRFGCANLLYMTPTRDKNSRSTRYVYQLYHVPSTEVQED